MGAWACVCGVNMRIALQNIQIHVHNGLREYNKKNNISTRVFKAINLDYTLL